jgi:hypothetical protein
LAAALPGVQHWSDSKAAAQYYFKIALIFFINILEKCNKLLNKKVIDFLLIPDRLSAKAAPEPLKKITKRSKQQQKRNKGI